MMTDYRDEDEEFLAGGVANAGRVSRIGGYVHRPAGPHADAIRRYLEQLVASGFAGAPRPAGSDADGRERFEYIPGDVAVPPYPEWAQSDEALASVAELLRRFHDASRAVGVTASDWSDDVGDPAGGALVCHNDVCLENVVFRDGRAVALLDFDFAAPGRAEYDLAQFARMCVPVDDEVNGARLGWDAVDRPARLRLVADAYGLTPAERVDLLALVELSAAMGERFVRARFAAGDTNFVAMWNAMGGEERYRRRAEWWAKQRHLFEHALS
jgi:hypothetical protein